MEAIQWFKVYPAETLSDELFSGWTIDERGAWFTLILVNWREGSIPSDQSTLARLLHVDGGTMRSLWSAIGSRFVRHPDLPDRLTSPRVEREREAAKRLMDQKVEAGKKGATSRWSREKMRNGSRIGLPCDASATAMANDSEEVREEEKREGQTDRQDRLAGIESFSLKLQSRLGVPRLTIGRNPKAVLDCFEAQLRAVGEDALVEECCDLASKSTNGVPSSLAWFVGWLQRLPQVNA